MIQWTILIALTLPCSDPFLAAQETARDAARTEALVRAMPVESAETASWSSVLIPAVPHSSHVGAASLRTDPSEGLCAGPALPPLTVPQTACYRPGGDNDDPIVRDGYLGVQPFVTSIHLSIHVFGDKRGTDFAATQADVDAAVDMLNANFFVHSFNFTYQTEFIRNNTYRHLAPQDEGMMKHRYADSPETMLNVYVTDTGTGISRGTFPWSPSAQTFYGGILIHETWFRADSPLPSIFTKLAGYTFGLRHTFHGVTEVPSCSECYEPVGRSVAVGDTTGDFCSDTQPTTDTHVCGEMLGDDPCVMPAASWGYADSNNFMANTHVCADRFTLQQAARMHCYAERVLGSWIQLPPAPAPPEPPGSPDLSKIGGGQILIAWADNSNDEDGFKVERERRSGNSWGQRLVIADVGANVTSFTDVPGSGRIRYRVQAYNGNGSSDWSSWSTINNN